MVAKGGRDEVGDGAGVRVGGVSGPVRVGVGVERSVLGGGIPVVVGLADGNFDGVVGAGCSGRF